MKLTRGFVQGIMNKDLDERLLPQGQYRDALNVGVSSATESDVGAIENQLGNTNKSNLTLHASATTIGAIADEANFNIYWFVTSDTFDYVFRYNQNTNVTLTILQDTKGRILNFNASFLITGINIINDLLFWTDNLNAPRRLNVQKTYALDGFTEDDISVIVKPPLFAPIIRLEDTSPGVGGPSNITGEENNIIETFIEFSYRYKYENDEYSAMAPFSSHAFYPGGYQYNYADWELTSMLNIFNKANIRFYLGAEQVKEVQLLYRESQSTNVNVIESFEYTPPYTWSFGDNVQAGAYSASSAFPANVGFTTQPSAPYGLSGINVPLSFEVGDEIFISQNVGFTHATYEGYHTIVEIIDQYTIVIDVTFAGATGVEPGSITIETKEKPFFNNKIYTVLPADELGRLFDNVPLKAKAQELIGSRLIYGNYVQFFDLIASNGTPISLDYSLFLKTKEVLATPLPTFRSDRDYEIGITYLDDYGRMTTVLTADTNTIHIPPANSNTANDIRVEIKNLPPAFATHFRFFIKQSKGNYETIFPLYFYQNGEQRWFSIGPGDINKVKEDEYIICKTAKTLPTNSVEKYKVIEIGSKPENFLNNSQSQAPGIYFQINDYTNQFNTSGSFTHLHTGTGLETMLTQNHYFLMPDWPVGSGYLSNLPNGVVNFPVFYGVSTTATSLIPTASLGFSAHQTSLGVSGLSYRLKIEVTDGPNNEFSYSSITQSGVENLIQSGVTMLNTIPGNELTTLNGIRLANVRFGHLPNQYNTGDYWMMSIHSMYPGSLSSSLEGVYPAAYSNVANSYIAGLANLPIGRPVSISQGNAWDLTVPNPNPPFLDRPIEAGARLEFTITQGDIFGNVAYTPTQYFYSSRRYENIEEWFWEDQIYNSFSQVNLTGGNDGGSRVIFKRGIQVDVTDTQSGSNGALIGNFLSNVMFQANASTPGVSGFSSYLTWADQAAYSYPVRMCIVGSENPPDPFDCEITNNQPCQTHIPLITVDFKITQTPDITIFETTPQLNPPNIYHELNQTFKITNGFHIGNITSQNTGVPAEISLNTSVISSATTQQIENSNFNSYCFGNGLEALRIRGGWNGYPLLYSPRASSVIDDYQQQRVEEGLTYSGIYRENTGINNLNEFNLSIANFKYLDRFFGSIQKLHARDTDVVVFQQNKVSRILYGKNLLSDAVGGGDIVSISEVLGTQITYAGEYGISDNPESFAYWAESMFFTDLKRGAVIKLGSQSTVPISVQGMKEFFKNLSLTEANTQKIGALDPFKEQYVLSTNDNELPCEFKVFVRPTKDLGNPFSVSSQSTVVCATIVASGNWTVSLVDTGDGTSWVLINNAAGTSLTGTGNAVVCFHYSANSVGANRSLRIDFSGCSSVTSYIAFQSRFRPIEVISYVVGNNVSTVDNPVCEAEDTLIAEQEYDFTSNTGSAITFKKTKFERSQTSLSVRSLGLGGQGAIPFPSDTVSMKAVALGTTTQRPFDDNLGNQMRYLVSNKYYSPEDMDALLAASTLLAPALVAGVYRGTFTYSTPGEEKYLYLIWDYTNKTVAGGALSLPSGNEGTTYAQIDYSTARGTSTIQYNANAVANRFIVKYGGKTAIDTGFVVGIGTVDLIKNTQQNTKACLIVETSGLDDGWTVQPGLLALTSFLLDLNNDDITTVCPRVPATTKYHDGAAALPAGGDTIYDGADGVTKYNGATAYHKMGAGDDYAFIDDNGLVINVGSCAPCSETAVPVLTIPNFIFNQNEKVDIQLEATNNPEEWSVVSACQAYLLSGNSSGGVFTISACNGSGTQQIQVKAHGTRPIGSLTTPVIVSGSTASFAVSGVYEPEILPDGLILSSTEGRIRGSAGLPGTYNIDVNATNCFGTSLTTSFIISVVGKEVARFNLDVANPESNPSDACAVTPSYSIYYHSGSGAYPVIDDLVLFLNELSAYMPYNGGNLWFLMDNNTTIKIGRSGVVLDVSICGVTKTTEAGDDKTTENNLEKTIE
jgi:hypothetical protein